MELKRIFFYHYDSSENYNKTIEISKVGCSDSSMDLITKFRKIRKGDVIILRDSSDKLKLSFWGYCTVISEPYQEKNKIWEGGDFTNRIDVTFQNSFSFNNIDNITWEKLSNLKWRNLKNNPMVGKQSLGQFLSGNFFEVDERFSKVDFNVFLYLLGYQPTLQNYYACDINEPEDSTIRNQILVNRIVRDTEKSKRIKEIYNHTCQICETQLKLNNNTFYSEAHHIKPLGLPHNGPDSGDNLICVCPNCHALLDYGALELVKEVIVYNKNHIIKNEYLDYHNTKIFNKIVHV